MYPALSPRALCTPPPHPAPCVPRPLTPRPVYPAPSPRTLCTPPPHPTPCVPRPLTPHPVYSAPSPHALCTPPPYLAAGVAAGRQDGDLTRLVADAQVAEVLLRQLHQGVVVDPCDGTNHPVDISLIIIND